MKICVADSVKDGGAFFKEYDYIDLFDVLVGKGMGVQYPFFSQSFLKKDFWFPGVKDETFFIGPLSQGGSTTKP